MESTSVRDELSALEKEVVEKRAEKTIAAQNAVRELLKKKEALMKRSKVVDAAAEHVRQALVKLQRTKAAGLQDWRELEDEKLKLSDYAAELLRDKATLAGLKAASSGGTLSMDGANLTFVGSSSALLALKKALEELESSYSCSVEVEGTLLRLFEGRSELKRFGDKHGVVMTAQDGNVKISGPADKARKAEKAFRFNLTGKVDLPCPRDLSGAAKVQAKEVEADTGAYIEVVRGGFGGGSIVHIRGGYECVSDAEEKMREWFDQREGAYSVFIDMTDVFKKLGPEKVQQFGTDLVQFGQKFRIAATTGELRVELRGVASGEWEAPARAELQQIVDWYSTQAEGAPKAKAKAAAAAKAVVPDESGWGEAPEAEIELGHKW